jgi:hypothetical protein
MPRKSKDFPMWVVCGECDTRFKVLDTVAGKRCLAGDGFGPLCGCCLLCWLDKKNRLPDPEAERQRFTATPRDDSIPF